MQNVRALFLLILVAAVVWLFIERHQLTGRVATLEAEVATKAKEITELKNREPEVRTIVGPGGTRTIIKEVPKKENWLDQHVERGAKALAPRSGSPR